MLICQTIDVPLDLRAQVTFAFAMAVVLITPVVCGEEAADDVDHVPELLNMTPKGTESVFCLNAKLKLRSWDDLNEASMWENYGFYTTFMASEHAVRLGLQNRTTRSAVNAIKEIRQPKPDPETGIVHGKFRSTRCELLLLTEDLPVNWRDTVTKRPLVRTRQIEGQEVVELSVEDELVLVVGLSTRLLCVANDAAFLAEVLRLAKGRKDEQPGSIVNDSEFSAARSRISKASPFWGIRMFERPLDVKDVTSIRNVRNIHGHHDPRAVSVTIELLKIGSDDLRFSFGSKDSAAVKRFIESPLRKYMKLKDIQGPLAVNPERTESRFVVMTCTCDLSKGTDEPGALFLYLAALFGQGFQI